MALIRFKELLDIVTVFVGAVWELDLLSERGKRAEEVAVAEQPLLDIGWVDSLFENFDAFVVEPVPDEWRHHWVLAQLPLLSETLSDLGLRT